MLHPNDPEVLEALRCDCEVCKAAYESHFEGVKQALREGDLGGKTHSELEIDALIDSGAFKKKYLEGGPSGSLLELDGGKWSSTTKTVFTKGRPAKAFATRHGSAV